MKIWYVMESGSLTSESRLHLFTNRDDALVGFEKIVDFWTSEILKTDKKLLDDDEYFDLRDEEKDYKELWVNGQVVPGEVDWMITMGFKKMKEASPETICIGCGVKLANGRDICFDCACGITYEQYLKMMHSHGVKGGVSKED